jgi:hypothetical protein
MKSKVYVEIIVDENDTSMAEAEVEGQLNDWINQFETQILEFVITDSEEIEEETDEDDF